MREIPLREERAYLRCGIYNRVCCYRRMLYVMHRLRAVCIYKWWISPWQWGFPRGQMCVHSRYSKQFSFFYEAFPRCNLIRESYLWFHLIFHKLVMHTSLQLNSLSTLNMVMSLDFSMKELISNSLYYILKLLTQIFDSYIFSSFFFQ